jgi:hypothetical protein
MIKKIKNVAQAIQAICFISLVGLAGSSDANTITWEALIERGISLSIVWIIAWLVWILCRGKKENA